MNDSRNAINTAAIIPDLMLGSTTVKNVFSQPAPKLNEASSIAKSKLDKLEAIIRIMNGSIITVCPINNEV
ncbi:hypothetical protein D3C77_547320 [compost metagenome]